MEQQGNITIAFQEGIDAGTFLENLKAEYAHWNKNNLILNLLPLSNLNVESVLLFKALSDQHRKEGKSFVLVSEAISYEMVPDEICLVPSLQEAFDIIEMDEIERDLGF